ncbi:MAG: hypothetical protein LBV03_07595 [Fusobacteriales bacterium]|nr:hypothetical protein [Fusobacteriales bacterium]
MEVITMTNEQKALIDVKKDVLKLWNTKEVLSNTLVKRMLDLTAKNIDGVTKKYKLDNQESLRLAESIENYVFSIIEEKIYEELDDISTEAMKISLAEQFGMKLSEEKAKLRESLLGTKEWLELIDVDNCRKICIWIKNFIPEQLQPN